MSSKIQTNNDALYSILSTINNLPDAGEGGVELPELDSPAAASELFKNKQLINEQGEIVTGTFTIDLELSEQDNLLTQIQTALENKAAGSEPELQSKTVSPTISSQIITADSGYDGLSDVTVNAIPNTYIQPTGTLEITENGTHNVTNYASVNVDVAGETSSGGDQFFNITVDQTSTSYVYYFNSSSQIAEATVGSTVSALNGIILYPGTYSLVASSGTYIASQIYSTIKAIRFTSDGSVYVLRTQGGADD